jgi:drug/metabolite transporter (DMT)-like permease
MPAVLPLVIVIASGIVYHLAQKVSDAPRPWSMLAVAYGAAFAITAVLAFTSSGADVARWSPRERAAGLLIGLAALGIEAGFFFIYRSGWPLASASVITNVVVTVILAVVGVVVFGERLTAFRGVGIVLASVGAALIARP